MSEIIDSKGSVNDSVLFLPGKDKALEIRDLKTSFPTFYGLAQAVRGVSLSLPKRQVLGVVGETGAGKSVTALSVVKLLTPPGRIDSGEIIFQDRDLVKIPESDMLDIRGKEISMVFQSPRASLNPLFTVGQQMTQMSRHHLGMGRKEAYNYALNWLERVGLSDPEGRIKQYPCELSTGMCQRVGIAIALQCNPNLLIADEPTTALDVTIQAQILDLFGELVKEVDASVMIITHDLGVMAELAQWIAVMYTGKVVEFGPMEEVFLSPGHPYPYELLASTPGVDEETRELHSVPGTIPDIFNLPKGCAFHPRCKLATDRCKREAPKETMIGQDHCTFCFNTDELPKEGPIQN